MKIKHFKHTGVSPSGKIASGGSVTVSGRVSKSAPDGGCGLDNCGCSPGHWISFCLPRTEEGVVEGVTIQFDNKEKDLKQFIKTTIREFLNENVNKPYSYFLRWTNDAGADVRRNFSGHMQAWFDTEKEAMDDYNERISDGKYIPYPPKKDITNGMWNSEPEWGLSGYGFRDEETFNNSMEEINDIAWHHSENLQQDLIVFRSSNFILGDGFDGEDVFRDADKYWYIEPDMNYNDVMNIIEEMDRFTK